MTPRARRVEAMVRREWQDVVQQRRGRRRAVWLAASCLTSAALIALVLHTHARPPSSDSAVSPIAVTDPSVPRHVMADFSRELR